MASTNILKTLESKASLAEGLISKLRNEINAIKANIGAVTDYQTEMKILMQENNQLKSSISEWKGKLVTAETNNGKIQLPVVPGRKIEEVITVAAESEKVLNPPLPENPKPKEEKKTKKGGGEKKAQNAAEESPVDVGRLDMRVGIIVSAKKHPDADSLYVEQVDVGEGKNRTVISGLVKFIPIEEMQNRPAILMCNLKPSKMRGILSEAMVMCASTPEAVEILTPPSDSKPGDLVMVDGYERNPDAQLNPKKKIFEACAPDLKVNEDKIATYKGIPWTVNGKFCTSKKLKNVQVK